MNRLLERLRANPSTVRDIPDADRLLKAALPIYIQDKDCPDHPGMWGTCSAVQYRGRTYFLTARHVVKGIENTTPGQLTILIPLEFGTGQVNCAKIRSILYPEPAEEQYQDACDVAVMVPTGEPEFVDGASRAINLDMVADLRTSDRGQLMVVAGYPVGDAGNNIDYETRQVNFKLFHALGNYDSAAQDLGPGCHGVEVSTRDVGGSQGMSGAPVLGVVEKDSGLSVAFAGIVIRGNERLLRFVDVAYIVKLLHDETKEE